MYLKTNFRVGGKQVDADAVGRSLDNWIDASTVSPNWHGGFIMGSWVLDRPATTAGVIPISAYGAICAYYGATWISNTIGRDGGHSGFKVCPVECRVSTPQMATVLCNYWARPAFSYSGSICFICVLEGSGGAAAAGSVIAALVSTESIAFHWWGWIVSTPWS